MALKPYKKEADGSLTELPLIASKLGTSTIGSTSKPIYLNNGVAQECSLLDEHIRNIVYPVGSIYMSVNSTNPSTFIGGTWEKLKDRFLLGSGDSYSSGATGGNKDAVVVNHNHTITQNVGGTIAFGNWGVIYGNGYESAPGGVSGNIGLLENYNSYIDKWAGSGNSQRGRNVYAKYNIPNLSMANAGEDGANKNMPPYLVVNMWKRTA